MALNSWQLLTRVLPGQPFGDGADGAYSSATIPILVKDGCSGSADSTSLTSTNSTFSNGDIVGLFQLRGTGAGQWEINRVVGGGGTTSLTLSLPLKYTFTNSGASKAQAVKIFRYTTVDAASGTWTVPSWDKNSGGILLIAAKVGFTPTATITASGKGFLGATGQNSNAWQGLQGEGTDGDNTTQSRNANGNAGGGGNGGTLGLNSSAGGAGASYGSSGNNGNNNNANNALGGIAGSTFGSSDLTSLSFGGAGATGGSHSEGAAGNGGNGGGIIIIYARDFSAPTSIVSSGNSGGNGGGTNAGAGGAGAGGTILIVGDSINIGTDKLSVIGASGGVRTGDSGSGGSSGKGRIAVYYNKSLSGTISSSLYGTYTSEQDTRLIETGGAFLFNML